MASGGERPTTADGNEDEDLKGQQEEWDMRLASGDLPEDFLRVTEPKVDRSTKPQTGNGAGSRGSAGASANPAFEPDSGNLVDTTTAVNGGDAEKVSPEKQKHSRPESSSARHYAQSPDAEKALLSTEEQDHALAMALQDQLNMEEAEAMAAHHAGSGGMLVGGGPVVAPANMVGRLTVTVVEARLAKNYGLTRMDPYCRVRVGHSVYETPTCANGSKEPKWNKTFNCYLLQGVRNVDVEIYDECTFSSDPLVAYGSFPLPAAVVENHEVSDEWYPLSGQEGAGKEGVVHLILSLQPIPPGQELAVAPTVRTVPNVGSGHRAMQYQPAYLAQGGQQQGEHVVSVVLAAVHVVFLMDFITMTAVSRNTFPYQMFYDRQPSYCKCVSIAVSKYSS